jgi:DNA processing protein
MTAPGPAERLARAALTRIAEPGDQYVGRWLNRYGAETTLAMIRADGLLPGVGEQRAAGYRVRRDGPAAEADLAAAEVCGGRFVCPGDAEWPAQLDDLGERRPIGLWVRGHAELRMWALRSVAVVGARVCDPYGTHVAAMLGGDLAQAGWTVVSGAAFGIDGAAHRGALAAGGPTVAVVACGVDRAYPPGHAELVERIAQQGLLVAELPPGSHPTRLRFVLRNRLIAALTRGTVVVQAQLRSGSLVTARWAQETGRVVMGVPGPVTSGLSAGVHELLRGEGQLVTDAAEVVELVGRVGADLAPPRRMPVLPRDLLAPDAAAVLDALPARGAHALDQIARDAGRSADVTLARLHELRSLGFAAREGEVWRLARPAPDGAPGATRRSPRAG